MERRIFSIAAIAALCLGGCAGRVGTPGGAVDPLQARGEQPGWRLTATPGRVVFASDDGRLLVDETNEAGTVPKDGRLQGKRIIIDSRVQACALGGSAYTQTVRVTVDGQAWDGCGGAQSRGLSLGAGKWNVLSVSGRSTPLDRPFEASFERGRLSLQLGCNRLTAPYALAGQLLSVGAVAATRMTCPDMSFETAGLQALALPFEVEPIGTDQLVLRNALGTFNLARARS
ncbi:META domain-containing protein [Sphingomonas humi]|uniref:DUF306 domain-containing protein n=1 Tax=Sphingomonas humi TaxID=335630 RepID=A0ABP7RQF7_9SPHN